MRKLTATALAMLSGGVMLAGAPVMPQSLWDTPPFGGIFVAVDARAIGDAGEGDGRLLGEEVVFADRLRWFGGRECETWGTEANGELGWAREDPVIHDLLPPPPAAPDPSAAAIPGEDMWLSCDGSPLAALVRVDDRVLVIIDRERETFLLLERPVHDEDARPLQQALNDAGYDAGPVDGDLGPRTRTAIAAYVADRLDLGSPPGAGVVTERLLADLVAPSVQ